MGIKHTNDQPVPGRHGDGHRHPHVSPCDWPRIWHIPGAAHEKADAAAGSLRDGRSASPAGVEQVDIPSG